MRGFNCRMDDFVFSEEDFIFKVDWNCKEKSEFSLKLENAWLLKKKHNYFRYDLKISKSRMLEGEYGFLLQLNTDRAVNRRTPEVITNVNQPFSIDAFNFTKAKQEEIMFFFSKSDRFDDNENRNVFMINVSPIEQYHSLLLPSLYKCLPQILNEDALTLGICSVLLNGSVEQRCGFNSLCAYASVNHLHLHTYYLNYPMKLETIVVEHLAGRCYVLENFPAKAFVFQVTTKEELSSTVNDIYMLVNLFIQKNVAHNVFISRGLSFDKSKSLTETSKRDCIRIYLWARTSSYGSKELEEFNPALCELFGHLVLKTPKAFEELTEAKVAELLYSITHEPYSSMKDIVKELYME